MKSIYDIIKDGQKNGKTYAEISADLAAAGYNTNTNGKKDGNAFVYMDESNQEPCMVSDGKVVVGTVSPIYTILYDGKEYHTAEDHVTLLEGPGVPDIQERVKLPKTVDRSRRMDLIGAPEKDRTGIIQNTAIGKFSCDYDDQGYLIRDVRV